jgi:DNA modification methylase
MVPLAEVNTLYYGDNLDILRRYIKDESADLVYLDPPFKSNQNYNVLFQELDGTRSNAQMKAFKDTWIWDDEARRVYEHVVESGGAVASVMLALHTFLGASDMLAYLAMMAPRLVELRRALKPTGTLFLHCDPTASHYLKLILDSVFGPKRFLNEISWKRSSAHSDTKQGMKRCGRIHDIILLYSKTDQYTWNTLYAPYTKEYLESEYRHTALDGRRYKETDLTAAKPGGDVEYQWHVKRPTRADARWEADLTDEYRNPKADYEYKTVTPYDGRFWGYSKANIVKFAEGNHLIHRSTGMPRLIQYADEMPGIPLQDLWDDIPPVAGKQDLGYPTQKPIALLERIINLTTNKDDLVLDPFCGCGTTIAAAQKLDRQWIGIDITQAAIVVIKKRFKDNFSPEVGLRVIGEPTALPDAAALAKSEPYQFQWWALGLVGARPTEEKKGADRGIDGRLYFHDEPKGRTKQIIFSVKAGKLHANYVRDLVGVINREKADVGVLISFEEPTKPMRTEAIEAGYYNSPNGKKYRRIQLLTVSQLFEGRTVDYPFENVTYRKGERERGPVAENLTMF